MNEFVKEIETTAAAVSAAKTPDALTFAWVTDTHLSDNGPDTRQTIAAVDKTANFEFLLHTGDFLNGFNPPVLSARLYAEEAAAYEASVAAKKLFVVQGNHDGFRDETWLGQNVPDAKPDDWYHGCTRFVDGYPETIREGDDSYYYADFPAHKVRLICMNSMYYTFNPENKEYHHGFGFSDAQYRWFCRKAIQAPDGWTLLVASHAPAVATYHKDLPHEGTANVHGFDCMEILQAVVHGEKAEISGETADFTGRNVSVAAWFYGHTHGDTLRNYKDIPTVSLASQTAYIPQLWGLGYGSFPSPRTMGTVNQDCWDAVVMDTEKRTLKFFRYGAGEDRVIEY